MFEKMDERNFLNSEEFKKYKKFAFRDDMFKLSVGIMLGNSFNKVVQGISDCLIMPVASYLISNTGSGWRNFKLTILDGLSFDIGKLMGIFVDFLVVSLILYVLYVKLFSSVKKEKEDAILKKEPQKIEKQCPHCFSQINEKAKRCPMCTGVIVVKKRRT